MKIKFTESVTIPAAGREKERKFKKGSVHDLSGPSAYRWVRRAKAVYYVEEVPKPKIGRPMMGISAADMGEAVESREFKAPEKFSVYVKDSDFTKATKPAKPKKVGRPKKGA